MITTFLMSTGFRWLFGEALEFLKGRTARKDEMELMRLQADIKKEEHERQQAAMRSAADLGIKEIQIRGEDLRDAIDAIGRLEATKTTAIVTGDVLIDRMNGLVRPLAAYICLLLVVLNAVAPSHVVLSTFALELCSSVLGVFVGGRIKTTDR